MFKYATYAIPIPILEGMEELVENGRFANRSEIVRAALRDLIEKEKKLEVRP